MPEIDYNDDSLPGLKDDLDSDDDSIPGLKDDSDSDDDANVTIHHVRQRLPWQSRIDSSNRTIQDAAFRDSVTPTFICCAKNICCSWCG
jgi:hypothetical protein